MKTPQEWARECENGSGEYADIVLDVRAEFANEAVARIKCQTTDESGYIAELVEWAYESSADIVEALARDAAAETVCKHERVVNHPGRPNYCADCGVGGMSELTAEEIAELRAKAEAARDGTSFDHRDFMEEHANPQTVLALLDRIAELEARYESHCDGCDNNTLDCACKGEK